MVRIAARLLTLIFPVHAGHTPRRQSESSGYFGNRCTTSTLPTNKGNSKVFVANESNSTTTTVQGEEESFTYPGSIVDNHIGTILTYEPASEKREHPSIS
ncbi:hypothetical protein DPMN_180228 [Dreissena polymorpha]|nr:hypothetical protein DPMN_180228 [Dreissena polymorpha]